MINWSSDVHPTLYRTTHSIGQHLNIQQSSTNDCSLTCIWMKTWLNPCLIPEFGITRKTLEWTRRPGLRGSCFMTACVRFSFPVSTFSLLLIIVIGRAHFLRHPRYKNVSGNKKRKTTTEMQTMKIPHEEQQVRHQIWTSAKRQIYKDFQKKCWWDVGVNCCCNVCVTRRSLMHQPSEY